MVRELGVPENVMYRWSSQHRQVPAQDITRAAQRAEAEEFTRLKRELACVTQERYVLKRAAVFFAKESR